MSPLTVPEAALALGVSRQRVHQLVASGKLKATRFGNALAIDPVSLKALQSSRKPKTGG